MKFIIKRTSGDPIYLKGLTRGIIHNIHVCNKDFCVRNPDNWFIESCTNITLVDEHGNAYLKGASIEGEEVYLYEVNTLDEMIALVGKVGEVIMQESECAEGYPVLEIYDAYRE